MERQWEWNDRGENVQGHCNRCGAKVHAMGLVYQDERQMFGKVIPAGWYCATCKPRIFGRINGERAMGWVIDTNGGDYKPKLRIKVMAALGMAMTSGTVKSRNRKPKAMKPL